MDDYTKEYVKAIKNCKNDKELAIVDGLDDGFNGFREEVAETSFDEAIKKSKMKVKPLKKGTLGFDDYF